jgi:hypothetical protein
MMRRLPGALPRVRGFLPAGRGLLASGAALAAILAASALAAPSAAAANGPPVVGCDTSSSCGVELSKMVSFSGNDSGHAGNVVVDIAPPPCLWIPEGDAHTGSQYVIDYENGVDPGPGAAYSQHETYLQAQQLLSTNPAPAGEWYFLPVNPAADAAGKMECYKLPLFYFATPGAPLPGVYIPPRTLGQLAFSRLETAQLAGVTLNPSGTSDANLPTSVQVTLGAPAAGQLNIAPDGRPYVAVTAYIQGGAVSATVWAEAGTLNINPGTSAARTFDASSCSQAQVSGATYTLGSRLTTGQLATIGVNGSVDCGVTYAAPGSFGLSASIGWTACWAPTPGATQPPPPPANCDPVPGASGLADSAVGPVAINVREIQTQS